MKKFGLLYIIPLLFALSFLLLVYAKINTIIFYKKANISADSSFRYIDNFHNNRFFEDQFLVDNDSFETIFILGSSELTVHSISTPYNFISDHFKTQLKGIGHAGNQCFSIYSQLLANENRLKDAPIIIVLSPGWFHSKDANGTSASLFLEFNSPRFLNAILLNDSNPVFKQYETERISDFYDEIVNPDLCINLLYFEHQSDKSILHKCFYFPIITIDNILNGLKLDFLNSNKSALSRNPVIRKSIIQDSVRINWDSLFATSKLEREKKSTNNRWGINNDYFNLYIKGKKSTVSPVKDKYNQELEDFKMLIKLLRTNKTRASFIILPLNPYYFTNLNKLSPLINSLQSEILKNNFPCLNFWNEDSVTFEKEVLQDVMHLSDYGWYKADKFIVDTYRLSK